MENLVLYRKYRPKTFDEVVNQEHIKTTLANAIATGKVAHAYLFCGPRGTGKTTIARLLAKTVNCENRGDASDPCNKCSACREFNDGRSLDLIEIDAASNRGIDEIRDLREGIKFSPARLKYKVFIIDEVHMLTREAFNALLKTLEEPPSHAIFILATTEAHKVPPTIISRCQKFDFHKLPLDKIVERLGQIAKKEGVKIEEEALNLIAVNAEGAMRDAESLLGQVLSVEDKNVTLKEVQAILGTTDVSCAKEMADYLIAKNLTGALALINNLAESGLDLAQFNKSLAGYLRKMMVLASSAQSAPPDKQMKNLIAPELTEEQIKIMLEQSRKFTPGDFIKILRLLVRVENEMKFAILPQLPLELAVMELLAEAK